MGAGAVVMILILVAVVSAVLLLADHAVRAYRFERKVHRLHREIDLARPSWRLDRVA